MMNDAMIHTYRIIVPERHQRGAEIPSSAGRGVKFHFVRASNIMMCQTAKHKAKRPIEGALPNREQPGQKKIGQTLYSSSRQERGSTAANGRLSHKRHSPQGRVPEREQQNSVSGATF